MKINREATIDKVLKSEFPTQLLESLVYLDERLRAVEKSQEDRPSEPPPVGLIEGLIAGAVSSATAFRDSWAAYDSEDETITEDKENDSENIQSGTD